MLVLTKAGLSIAAVWAYLRTIGQSSLVRDCRCRTEARCSFDHLQSVSNIHADLETLVEIEIGVDVFATFVEESRLRNVDSKNEWC